MPTLGPLVSSPGDPVFNFWLPEAGNIPTIHLADIQTRVIGSIRNADGVALDISDADLLSLFLRSPSNVVTENFAEFLTDGTDGQLCYTLPGGFLTLGKWAAQFQADFGDYSFHGPIHSFRVLSNL